MPSFSHCIVVLIFMHVFATVLADENRSKVEKHFGKTDATRQSEKATNLDDGLQNVESEEPLGYPYISYESTKNPTRKIAYNTTQNITAFVEESGKPSSSVDRNRQGYIKSNNSNFKNKIEESKLSHVRLSIDRIPEERLLTISRQGPIGDGTMQVHQEETARIKPKKEHELNKFQTNFEKAGTQERNKERYMTNGQRNIQIKQGTKKTERAKLGEWFVALMKGQQRMTTREDSTENGRETSRESEWQKIEHAKRKVDRTGKNKVMNAERESTLESIKKSSGAEWENIQEKKAVVKNAQERVGSEWSKWERTDIGTIEKNGERIEERVGKLRMGEWRKKRGQEVIIDSKGEIDTKEGELGRESDREKTEERIEKGKMGEWRENERKKAIKEKLGRIEGKFGKEWQYGMYVGDQVRQSSGDETGYGRKGMVNEGQYVSAKEKEAPKRASESWKEIMNRQDKTRQKWMEKIREGEREVLGVHGEIQAGILEQIKAGNQGIDRKEKGELWIQANIGRIQERLRNQETNRVSAQRGRIVFGGQNKRMMGEQIRMNRDRVSQGMIFRKQERKTGMRVGMNEYKEGSGEEIAESGISTGWNKLLGVVDEGRDEY